MAGLVKLFRRSGRTALLWLLAGVVPLQCSAAIVRVAAGQLHGHATSTAPVAQAVELRDFRRATITPAAHGHAHRERHHHAPADATVIADDDADAVDRRDAGDEGATSAGGAFASLLPLVSALAAWQAAAAADAPPDAATWWASSRSGPRLERPPQQAKS